MHKHGDGHSEYDCFYSCCTSTTRIRTGTVIIFHDNESTHFHDVQRWEYELFLGKLNGADKMISFSGKDFMGDLRELQMRRKWVGAVRWEEN